VWATPLASFVVPEDGIIDPILSFLIFFGMSVVWFALAEEIGMRGYLQPRLMSLGKAPALLVVGLVFATWHMPLIFLPPGIDFPTGNLLLFFPLFYGTFVAASFFFGYLRIYTGSLWPASIAHAVHNAAWNVLGAVTLITAAPVLVNVYLVGDFGLLILIGTAIGATCLRVVWTKHNRTQRSPESSRRTPQPRRLPPGSHGRSQPNPTTTKNGTASQAGMPFRSCEAVLFTGVRGTEILGSSARKFRKIVHLRDTLTRESRYFALLSTISVRENPSCRFRSCGSPSRQQRSFLGESLGC
jgi:membrane protease YdiL (CAAX protease family)